MTNDMDTVQTYIKKYKRMVNFLLYDELRGFQLGPVITAVESGSMEMLDLIVTNKGYVNHQTQPGGQTALLLAIEKRRKDMVEYLLNHNADPSLADNAGNVFHYCASYYRDVEAVSLFSKYASVLINQKQTDGGYTPLFILIFKQYDDEQYTAPGVLEVLKLYLDLGADVSLLFEYPDFLDQFLLFIEYHKNEYLSLLLSYLDKKLPNITGEKADYLHDTIRNEYLSRLLPYQDKKLPNITEGANYLHAAILYANYDIIPVLLPYIEDINSTNNFGQTALHMAAIFYNSSLEIKRLLLEEGADKTIKGYIGLTCLEIIQLLLEKGADKTIKDNDGKTAYDLYMKGGDIDETVVNLLKVD
jgi:ankyrin repeat protein